MRVAGACGPPSRRDAVRISLDRMKYVLHIHIMP